MPREWPIAAAKAERETPARAVGRRRLATVRADFFLDSSERLTEQERALMTAMLDCLVDDIASDVQGALPSGLAPANDDVLAAESLIRAGLLDDSDLMALLLRRADEERIASAARARNGHREPRVIQGLVSYEDGAVSAAAMALILARGRRRDRFGQCLISFDDLSGASAESLVCGVAASLRRQLASAHGLAAADSELGAAAVAVAARHDRARSIEALANALIVLLENVGGLSDELLLACIREGEVAFLAQVLARRARIAPAVAADELLSGSATQVMALFRVAESSRPLAAGLLAALGDLLGIEDAGAAIDFFDGMGADEIAAASSWLTTPPIYRAAVAALGNGNG